MLDLVSGIVGEELISNVRSLLSVFQKTPLHAVLEKITIVLAMLIISSDFIWVCT